VARLMVVGGSHEHPPLFYLLAHLGLAFDNSYVVPRLLSAGAGAASVFALYALGRRLHSAPAGLIAAALLASAPVHLWHSQDGRAYEMAGLTVLLSYLALQRAWRLGSMGAWAVYVVATLLALYTDYTTAFVLMAQALYLARGRRQAPALLLSWLAVVLGFVPWLRLLSTDAAHVVAGYWVQPPTWETVQDTVLEFLGVQTACPTGSNCVPTTLPPFSGRAGTTLAMVAIAMVIVVAMWAAMRRHRTAGLLATWTAIPFVFLLGISTVRPLFLDRYVLGSTFGLYLLLAAGAAEGWRRRRRILPLLAPVVTVALFAGSLVGSGEVFAVRSNPDWKTPVRDFAAAYRPGDVAVYYPSVLAALVPEYLPPRMRGFQGTPIWLNSYLDVPTWTRRYAGRSDYALRAIELAGAVRGHTRAWVLRQDYPGDWDLWRWFDAHGFHRVIEETYALGTHLELWSREPAGSFGPTVVRVGRFGAGWTHRGAVVVHGRRAVARGGTTLTRRFTVTQGEAYVVSLMHRTPQAPQPRATVTLYRDCRSAPPRDIVGNYPQLPHVDLWSNGTWDRHPFGFVAPPGTNCGVLRLSTTEGVTTWRAVGVQREG
jgi:hypothetical protein